MTSPSKPVTERPETKTGIRVTVLDHASGETETVEVPAGEYLLTVTAPAFVAHTNVFANGTHVVTVKGRIRRSPPPSSEGGGR